jgi:hypothetical protein
MRDGANFCRLCNSFMCRSSYFLKGVLPKASSTPTMASAIAQSAFATLNARPSMLDVLVAYPSLQVSSALS